MYPIQVSDYYNVLLRLRAISDRREKELSDLGFIPLVYCKGTDFEHFLPFSR
ncbi:type VI secretion system contractile sheath domain-containing protein [Escherichia coli]